MENWKQLYIWERSVCESVYEVIVVWQHMQRVSSCQRWWSNHVSWQPAWGDEKWQMGLGRARPSLLSVPTRLYAEPSIYRDSRATEQKKAFFHQLGWTTGVWKLRSASQWLNSAHLAALAFKHYFFHDGLNSMNIVLIWSIKVLFCAWDLPTHPSNCLHIYPSTQPSSCLNLYLSVYSPKHIAVYPPIFF